MKGAKIGLAAAMAAMIGGAAYWTVGAGGTGARPLADPDDAAQVALGERVYAEACAACHGADLAGAPNWREPGPDGRWPAPPHDASGHSWHHDDRTLFDYVKQGGAETLAQMGVSSVPSGMPGFGGRLSDEEIRAVLAFIKASWPEEIQEAQRARSALAAQ